MSCVKYEPGPDGCGECDYAENDHPLTVNGDEADTGDDGS